MGTGLRDGVSLAQWYDFPVATLAHAMQRRISIDRTPRSLDSRNGRWQRPSDFTKNLFCDVLRALHAQRQRDHWARFLNEAADLQHRLAKGDGHSAPFVCVAKVAAG